MVSQLQSISQKDVRDYHEVRKISRESDAFGATTADRLSPQKRVLTDKFFVGCGLSVSITKNNP